jgi:hypothetical protein
MAMSSIKIQDKVDRQYPMALLHKLAGGRVTF